MSNYARGLGLKTPAGMGAGAGALCGGGPQPPVVLLVRSDFPYLVDFFFNNPAFEDKIPPLARWAPLWLAIFLFKGRRAEYVLAR